MGTALGDESHDPTSDLVTSTGCHGASALYSAIPDTVVGTNLLLPLRPRSSRRFITLSQTPWAIAGTHLPSLSAHILASAHTREGFQHLSAATAPVPSSHRAAAPASLLSYCPGFRENAPDSAKNHLLWGACLRYETDCKSERVAHGYYISGGKNAPATFMAFLA